VEQLDEYDNHDMRIISWLRAREFDLDKAESMIRTSMEWRQSCDFNKLLAWKPPANYEGAMPYQMCGYDNEGCPVIIMPICEWDRIVRKELSNGGQENLLRFLNQFAAKILAELKALSKPAQNKMITRYVLIFDLNGFSLRHLTSISIPEVLFESFRRFERNFPETLKVAYVVNAPRLFAMLYPVVKQILTARTANKVQVYDSNGSNWKPILLDKIKGEQLPIFYGGILADTLQDKIRWAKDYTENCMSSISLDKAAMNTVTIEAGSKLKLEYMQEPNSRISWIFQTDDYDIGFSLFYNDDLGLIPPKRFNSQATVQDGSYLCTKAGKYTLTFDNTYSLLRKKTLHYIVTTEDAE
jgi:hypothetical protein